MLVGTKAGGRGGFVPGNEDPSATCVLFLLHYLAFEARGTLLTNSQAV